MRPLPQIRPQAEIELHQAVIWYEGMRPGLGREFIAEFRAALRKVANSPLSFPVDYRDARRALLDRFPYKVYFLLDADQNPTVIAVLHASQSKTRLRGRIK